MQAAALEKRFRLAGLQRGADDTRRDTQNAVDGKPSGGADDIAAKLQSDLAGVSAEVEKARGLAEVAAKEANTADQFLKSLHDRAGVTDADRKNAEKAAETANTAKDAANENAEEIAEAGKIREGQLKDAAAKGFDGLKDKAEEDITSKAEEAVGKIKGIMDDQGGRLSADIGGAFTSLIEMLGDKKPNAEQVGQIQQMMKIAAGSQDALHANLSDYFRESAKKEGELSTMVKTHTDQIRRLMDRATN